MKKRESGGLCEKKCGFVSKSGGLCKTVGVCVKKWGVV